MTPHPEQGLRAWLRAERDALKAKATRLEDNGARDFERGRLEAGAYHIDRLIGRIPAHLPMTPHEQGVEGAWTDEQLDAGLRELAEWTRLPWGLQGTVPGAVAVLEDPQEVIRRNRAVMRRILARAQAAAPDAYLRCISCGWILPVEGTDERERCPQCDGSLRVTTEERDRSSLTLIRNAIRRLRQADVAGLIRDSADRRASLCQDAWSRLAHLADEPARPPVRRHRGDCPLRYIGHDGECPPAWYDAAGEAQA